ncbi:MAG: GTPase Era [Clostridiales bacterium]|nr:GTPase Era [Clostridiales bacterium]
MIEIFGECDYIADLTRVYDTVEQTFSLPKRAKVLLSFVSSEEIRALNKSTRDIDKVTDVLTYPYIDLRVGKKLRLSDYKEYIDNVDKTLTIGDIYICLDRAREQAEEYGHSLRREVCFLLCHGLLHILGYDHMEKIDEELMTQKQEEIMGKVGISRQMFKSGFVTILGETNAGKSTIINQLVGEHVAIVSPKSQTTRENIQGIYNDDDCQIVFVDTPGYHKRATKIDDEMDKHIANAQEDTEIILMLIVANKPLVPQYEKLINKVNQNAKKILLINKIDETKYEKLYPQLSELNTVAKVDEILPISAMKGKNTDVLLDMIKKYLPTYDFEMRYYPIEEYTDKNLRHMVAEMVREKALLCLDDEIPHGVQVVVTQYLEDATPIQISADMYCEKDSHKAIILGKGGEMIKKISTLARKSIEKIVGEQINLEIYVKVKANWRNDSKAIAEFGLNVSE